MLAGQFTNRGKSQYPCWNKTCIDIGGSLAWITEAFGQTFQGCHACQNNTSTILFNVSVTLLVQSISYIIPISKCLILEVISKIGIQAEFSFSKSVQVPSLSDSQVTSY